MDAIAARYNVLASAAVGELIGGLESLSVIKLFDSDGPLRGTTEFRHSKYLPTSWCSWFDGFQGAAVLKATSVLGAITVLTAPKSRRRQIIGSGLMYGASAATDWRSPYGRDGADQMAVTISGYRVATAFIPSPASSDDLFLRGVNLQTAISYFASGAAKAISSSWMSGTALNGILQTRIYGASAPAKMLRKYNGINKYISWGTIAAETAFPLIYMMPKRQVQRCLLLAKVFHLSIAVTMGLPRFFWGFNASHYAVRYVKGA